MSLNVDIDCSHLLRAVLLQKQADGSKHSKLSSLEAFHDISFPLLEKKEIPLCINTPTQGYEKENELSLMARVPRVLRIHDLIYPIYHRHGSDFINFKIQSRSKPHPSRVLAVFENMLFCFKSITAMGTHCRGIVLTTAFIRVVLAACDSILDFHPANRCWILSRIKDAFLLAESWPSMKPPRYLPRWSTFLQLKIPACHLSKFVKQCAHRMASVPICSKKYQDVICIHQTGHLHTGQRGMGIGDHPVLDLLVELASPSIVLETLGQIHLRFPKFSLCQRERGEWSECITGKTSTEESGNFCSQSVFAKSQMIYCIVQVFTTMNTLALTHLFLSIITSFFYFFYLNGLPSPLFWCLEGQGKSNKSNLTLLLDKLQDKFHLKGAFTFPAWILLWHLQLIPLVMSIFFIRTTSRAITGAGGNRGGRNVKVPPVMLSLMPSVGGVLSWARALLDSPVPKLSSSKIGAILPSKGHPVARPYSPGVNSIQFKDARSLSSGLLVSLILMPGKGNCTGVEVKPPEYLPEIQTQVECPIHAPGAGLRFLVFLYPLSLPGTVGSCCRLHLRVESGTFLLREQNKLDQSLAHRHSRIDLGPIASTHQEKHPPALCSCHNHGGDVQFYHTLCIVPELYPYSHFRDEQVREHQVRLPWKDAPPSISPRKLDLLEQKKGLRRQLGHGQVEVLEVGSFGRLNFLELPPYPLRHQNH
ncbi:uncharacterized protein G2W53_014204 [Senna tora]|uniref:Uncharacterized protein n=1 Tax=Senna tora TaxID=362788 RepID=A0A835C605_9FABA|nr:uncharacterized protein G2W53_014204 [Senna tora]